MTDVLVNLERKAAADETRNLLMSAMPEADAERLRAELRCYQSSRESRVLLGWLRNDQLVGLVGARPVYRIVCEILHVAVLPEFRGEGIGGRLIEAAADCLDAVAIRADIDGSSAEFWQACGFTLRPLHLASEPQSIRAERRHPPEPEGFFTSPRIDAIDERALAIELPPSGNTLPLIPEALRDEPIPAFVLDWILATDEVVLMMQDLAPTLLPPVTPAVRTATTRDLLGPPTSTLAYRADGTLPDSHEPIPGLPNGVGVPMRILEMAEMGERISGWLHQGARVRAWAEARGCGDLSWMSVDSTGAYSDATSPSREALDGSS